MHLSIFFKKVSLHHSLDDQNSISSKQGYQHICYGYKTLPETEMGTTHPCHIAAY